MNTPPRLSCTLRAAASRSNSAGLDSMMCIQQRTLGRWYGLTTVSHSSVAPWMSGYWNFQYRMSSMRSIGRLDVAGLADGDADRLVAGEPHEQELVVAIAEERGEAREDADGVGVPVRPHHLLDHAEQVGHDLLLPVAQRLVFEEEETDGEAVLEIVDPEQGVDGVAEHRGEERERRRGEVVVRRRLERLDEGGDPASGEKREPPRHGFRVGEVLALRERPRRDVEVVADAAVAGAEQVTVERLGAGASAGREAARWARLRSSVSRSRKLGLVPGQQALERSGETRERLVVLAGVGAGERLRRPGEKSPQEQRELLRRERRIRAGPATSSASRPKRSSRSSERSK